MREVKRQWQQYLEVFHGERAGITELVLEHAFDPAGRTPYEWAAECAGAGAVVDLACGSAPMSALLSCRRYVGIDLSAEELAVAARRGAQVVRADATRLPLPDGSADTVVMSMALMLVPLERTLAEVRRVLKPGGLFVATLPHNRPMPRTDWLRYGRLCLALRHLGLSYPNDQALADAGRVFSDAGLVLAADEARAFVCDIADTGVAEQLLASLYLPDVSLRRMAAGRRVVHRWVGSTMTTPIRRLIARCV